MRPTSLIALLALTVACAPDEIPDTQVDLEPEILDQDDDGWLDSDDCDDARADVHPDATEVENGVDDNCDGLVDEGTDAYDDDHDGWTERGGDCNDEDATVAPDAVEIAYDGVDQDCDGADLIDADHDGFDALAAGGDDCDDTDALVFPGADERANHADDNCDGVDDEGTTNFDDDGDGWAEVDGDCDDADDTRSPGIEEIPYDGIDNDCDGVDERDLDGDHHDAEATGGRDCDDTDPTIYEGADEIAYDGVDQDCDGADLVDVDGDGEPALAAGGLDCDDDNAAIRPGLIEVADYLDNDCNGQVDEDTEYGDDDGDGFSEAEGDCDDTSADAYPGQVELPGDGLDNDCDLLKDEVVLSATAATRVRDTSSGTLFGSVLAAGDFDGDGLDDLAIAAPQADDAGSDAGEVWVVPAAAFGQGTIDAAASWSVLGSNSSDTFGASLATVPDLDGDGAPELLVGAPGSSTVGSKDGGAWLIYSLDTVGHVLDESADDVVDVLGTGQNNARGGSAVAAGDLDGDGLADMVVASSTASSSKGKVWLTEGVIGTSGGYGAFDLGAGGLGTITGADNNDELGGQLAVLKDLDGDGYGELAVTATGEGAVYLFAGDDLAISKTSSDADARIEGPTRAFGAFTAADLDNDGDLDLIGADPDTGLYVWLNDGLGFTGTLRDTDADVEIGTAGQDLGTTLALGDLDNDGTLDLLLGAPGNSLEISGGGAVWITDAAQLLSADGFAIEAIATPILGDVEDAAAGGALVIGDGFWATGGETSSAVGYSWLVLVD
jgi:hypothetical protein